jgi:hypothetical protein
MACGGIVDDDDQRTLHHFKCDRDGAGERPGSLP